MGKMIRFSDFSRAPKRAAVHGYIQFDEIEKCMDMLYIQAGLLDELSQYAEDLLRELSLDPAAFALSPESADEYMKLNFKDFATGKEDAHVWFEACDKDMEYTLEFTATCSDQQSIDFDGTLFRKSSRGSEVYDQSTLSWCQCPD